MNGIAKRMLSLLLCLCLVMGVVPVAALADEIGSEEVEATQVAAISEENAETAAEVTIQETEAQATEEAAVETTAATEPESIRETTAATEPEATDETTVATEPTEETVEETTEETYAVSEEETLTEEERASRASIDGRSSVWGLEDKGFTLVSDKESTLAPGIQEHKTAVKDRNGNRVEMFIAEVDPSVDTVKIFANYKDNQYASWGMQRTTEQAAAFEANHPDNDVVVAINASYYNTANGQPTGAFVMEGVDINGDAGNSYSFFALLKDGTYMIGDKGEYSKYKGQIQEAIGGWIHLVNDGTVTANLDDSQKYPRQTIGLTANGKIVILTADGNRAPISDGLTLKEQAEAMVAMGCVEAIHLDGGGSATYCSRAAGTDTLVVVNNPSNGSERAVSNTLMVVSTAAADGKLDYIQLTATNNYITPGSSVEISAVGVDASGGVAEIPEGITWQAELGTYADGVFTSDGTEGTAAVTVTYEGETVGEVEIHVVQPTRLSFGADTIVVPYGKTVELSLKAYYNENEMIIREEDVEAVLDNTAVGTLEGLQFTATSDQVENVNSQITFTLKANPEITATSTISLGKASEVVFDFEAGTDGANTDNWIVRTHDGTVSGNEHGSVSIVDRQTGLVHDGEQALAFHADFSQTTGHGSNTAGYLGLALSWGGEPVSIKDAKSVGFWMYIPEDAMTTEISINAVYNNSEGKLQRRTVDATDDNGTEIYTPYWSTHMEESGWHYIKADFSEFSDDLYIRDDTGLEAKRNFFIKIYCVFGQDSNNFADYHGDFTYYIDTVTVDYSDAVEDRELPVFGNAQAFGKTETTLSHGQAPVISDTELSFSAAVADNTGKNNYTGLDGATAQIRVDGNPVYTTYSNGTISSGTMKLNNGYHTVRFTIADKNGNSNTIVRGFTVSGSKSAAVQLVPKDEALDRLYAGSVYWVDLVSDNVGDVQAVDMVLNLNSINTWELDHMDVSRGFQVTYSQTAAQKAENNVTLHVARTADTVDSSNRVIVSIPVRVWSLNSIYTPQQMWQKGLIDPREVRIKVDQGLVTLSSGTTAGFSDTITVDTEAYTAYYAMDKSFWSERGTYHVHTVTALEDKVATCTENGYTGRTYCAVCDSVVAWGTTQKAGGHDENYDYRSGELACSACGELAKVTGLIENNGFCYYAVAGKLQQRWQLIDDSWYFFYPDSYKGATGTITGGNATFPVKYTLKNGKLESGVWSENNGNYRYYYGPGYYNSEWATIDGSEYYFDDNGYRLAGYNFIKLSKYNHTDDYQMYLFSEDGKLLETLKTTGLLEANGHIYYLVDGIGNHAGLIQIGEDYYYINGSYMAVTGERTIYHPWDNGLLPVGTYTFGEDGKMIQDKEEKLNGIVGDYYYIDGVMQKTGLTKIGDDYYYFSTTNGVISRNVTKMIYRIDPNCDLPKGEYTFDADGKVVFPSYNGIVGDYYYIDGVIQMTGLTKIGDDYYYFSTTNGVMSRSVTKMIYRIDPDCDLPKGEYTFGEDGKVVFPDMNGIVGDYYYIDGVIQMTGLTKIGDDYYYFSTTNGVMSRSVTKMIYRIDPNCDLPKGEYTFGEDGKVVFPSYNGIVGDYYYIDGVIQMTGLTKIGDDYYYFSTTNGVMSRNVTKMIYRIDPGCDLPKGVYTFGADGKVIFS